MVAEVKVDLVVEKVAAEVKEVLAEVEGIAADGVLFQQGPEEDHLSNHCHEFYFPPPLYYWSNLFELCALTSAVSTP